MSKPRTSMLVGLLAALVLVCLATFTLYARQQKPAQPTDAACKCQFQGTTEGVGIIHCACPSNLNCLVARSVSTGGPAGGSVSTSCK